MSSEIRSADNSSGDPHRARGLSREQRDREFVDSPLLPSYWYIENGEM
jgi:hypothetical protein